MQEFDKVGKQEDGYDRCTRATWTEGKRNDHDGDGGDHDDGDGGDHNDGDGGDHNEGDGDNLNDGVGDHNDGGGGGDHDNHEDEYDLCSRSPWTDGNLKIISTSLLA